MTDDVKPLDLTIASLTQHTKQQNEQPLNLCSKRKRHQPVSLSASKRSTPPSTVVANPVTTAAAAAAAASSMFIPFYAISPFFDSTSTNQQEIFQQFQSFYLQLQQQQKLTNETPANHEWNRSSQLRILSIALHRLRLSQLCLYVYIDWKTEHHDCLLFNCL